MAGHNWDPERAEFEWLEQKARDNLQNHKVSFEEAQRVFCDLYAITGEDRIEGGEWRSVTIGMVPPRLQVIVVAYTVRQRGDRQVIRIISARKANRKERRQYGRQAR